MIIFVEHGEATTTFLDEFLSGINGRFNGANIVCDVGKSRDIERFFLDQQAMQLFTLLLIGALEKVQDRKG